MQAKGHRHACITDRCVHKKGTDRGCTGESTAADCPLTLPRSTIARGVGLDRAREEEGRMNGGHSDDAVEAAVYVNGGSKRELPRGRPNWPIGDGLMGILLRRDQEHKLVRGNWGD